MYGIIIYVPVPDTTCFQSTIQILDTPQRMQGHGIANIYSIIKLPYFLAIHHMVVNILSRYCIPYMYSSLTSYKIIMMAYDGHYTVNECGNIYILGKKNQSYYRLSLLENSMKTCNKQVLPRQISITLKDIFFATSRQVPFLLIYNGSYKILALAIT